MQEIPLPLKDGLHQMLPSSALRKCRRSPVANANVDESSAHKLDLRLQS